MSNEVTTTQKKPALQVGGGIAPIVPQDFDQAWRYATAVAASGMAPKGYLIDQNNPNAGFSIERITIAMLHGMEVGFTPMAALQSIAVINGFPSIWGDGALALIQASGELEYKKEWIEGEGKSACAFCAVKRKGQNEATRHFSMAQATKAGLANKKGPWQQYPERMLQMRARAFALRDEFADVLRGLHVAEEVQDFHGPENARDVTPKVAPAERPKKPEPSLVNLGEEPVPSFGNGEKEVVEVEGQVPEEKAEELGAGFSFVSWDGEVIEADTPDEIESAALKAIETAPDPMSASGITDQVKTPATLEALAEKGNAA